MDDPNNPNTPSSPNPVGEVPTSPPPEPAPSPWSPSPQTSPPVAPDKIGVDLPQTPPLNTNPPIQPESTGYPSSVPSDIPTAPPISGVPPWNPAPSTPVTQPQPVDPDKIGVEPPPPTPTFTPPENSFTPPTQTTSPLDNPWGAPTQTPPFDEPSQSIVSNQPNLEPNPNITSESNSIPTDLSHLISSNPPAEAPQNPINDAETLVVPPSGTTPDVPTLPLENHKGIPKWLIGVGIGLLIVVAGASAYFILGIGQAPKQPVSVPAQTTNQVKPPAPIPTAVPQPSAPAATGSANFGSLEGSQASSSGSKVIDTLKHRQQ